MRLFRNIILFSVAAALFYSCAENNQQEEDAVSAPVDTSAAAKTPDTDITTPAYTESDGMHIITNERFAFTFSVPPQYQVTDRSNNGDGYFITTGDAGTDLRIYGENIGDNPLAAELALSACEQTEKFRFANGYPGILCLQGGDKYYYYDTPTTRVTFYVHGSDAWISRNAATIQSIAESIRVGN